MRELLRDLKRFLRTGSVIEIGAAFALASVGVGFIATFLNTLVLYPLHNSNRGEFSGMGSDGTFAIDHRLFDYEDFLVGVVTLALVIGAVALVVRWNRENIFGDKTFAECPHCLAEIPVGASVCSFCTRDVALTTAR